MIFIYLLITGCKKESDFLDIKTNKSDVVPETLIDFQALLDNNDYMNQASTAGLPGADNTYLTDVNFAASSEQERNLYTWNKVIWGQETAPGQWESGFKTIVCTNVILEGLKKLNGNGYEFNNVKGEAQFLRAFAYYNLAQLFCKTYSPSADEDLGLPLRYSADVNILVQRSTLKNTYQQIISDALDASELLPESQPYITRPSKTAAYALLAKIYLNMGDYIKSEQFASKCLSIKPQLLDFNNTSLVNLTTTYRFPTYAKNNPEVMFYVESNQFFQVFPNPASRGFIVKDFYASYENDDLRKIYFYALSGTDVKFRGSYSGSFANFCGLATNEIYLIRAECRARNGNFEAGMADLNFLLKNRYKNGSYFDKVAVSADDALNIILNERRKELPATSNIRWEDLKRLNKEIRFQKTLTRIIDNITYTLLPNDKRYVLPIPTLEVQLSGIQQNER